MRNAGRVGARSGCQIGAVALHIPIRGARALLNSLALAYRPAPFGESDTVVRQPECAELLQGTHLLEPGMECDIHESEPVAEHIRSPSRAPRHHNVFEEQHAIEHFGGELPPRLLFPREDEAVRSRI